MRCKNKACISLYQIGLKINMHNAKDYFDKLKIISPENAF